MHGEHKLLLEAPPLFRRVLCVRVSSDIINGDKACRLVQRKPFIRRFHEGIQAHVVGLLGSPAHHHKTSASTAMFAVGTAPHDQYQEKKQLVAVASCVPGTEVQSTKVRTIHSG